MRLLITGDRNWTDKQAISRCISYLYSIGYDVLIHGAARGVDTIASEEAGRIGMTVVSYPAKWAQYHKAAGMIRNQQMLDDGKPDLVIWFHNNIDNSRGTKDMIARSKKQGILTICYSMI